LCDISTEVAALILAKKLRISPGLLLHSALLLYWRANLVKALN
jgi:hypothetical protein